MSNEVKPNLKYTKDHEWARRDEHAVVVGVTAYAVDQLGDVTLVNLDVAAGDELEKGKAFGTVESVKTLADLYAPISGKVLSVNETLEDQPELVNDDCYGAGWLLTLAPSDAAAMDDLLDSAAYQQLLDSDD